MRIDAHHHVWDLDVRAQDWIVGEARAPIRRSFFLAELLRCLPQAGIAGTIVVQTVPDPSETSDLLNLARDHDEVVGVVGWVDLESPDVASELDRHLSHPAAAKLVGIRDLAQYKPDAAWLARPDVIANMQLVGQRGLSYDLLTVPEQLAAATSAVRACPEVTFILDHLSKPHIAAGEIDPWARSIKKLAEMPNVVCKVSGMVNEADWERWTERDFRPYFATVLEAFGPERLMFGSDWPVCLLAADYQRVVDLATSLVTDLSDDEQAAFWAGTARRWYRLD